MRIIPAIDIIDAKCVRLTQGDYAQKKIYNESPLEVAKTFEGNGIKYLHLVDLDGAKARKVQNLKVLESICSQTSLIVDFGGGVQTDADIQDVFNAGASKITAGSIAVKDEDLVKKWIQCYGAERIILGADVKDDEIMTGGWENGTGISIRPFVANYLKSGITELISTDIAVDGMLTGPSTALYKRLITEFPNLKLIASGGVSSLNDLDALKAIKVDGVIIGKAIYENRITLKELQNYVS